MTTKKSLYRDYKDKYFDDRDTILSAKDRLKNTTEDVCRFISNHVYDRAGQELENLKKVGDDIQVMLALTQKE